MIDRDYTINYNLLKDEADLPKMLANLSKKANVFILARHVDVAEIQNYVNKLIYNRVRRPMLTNVIIGEIINDREYLECILSSI